jgi:hypothetical protein
MDSADIIKETANSFDYENVLKAVTEKNKVEV